MTPERWQRVKQLFQVALDAGRGGRSAFLDQACGGDLELHQEIDALFASQEQAEAFIETLAAELEPGLLLEQGSWPMEGRQFGP